jgi:hypothetical protein
MSNFYFSSLGGKTHLMFQEYEIAEKYWVSNTDNRIIYHFI